MILCNLEIQAALDSQRLFLTPEPAPRRPVQDEYCPYDTHSVDLKLATELIVPDEGAYNYDLMQKGSIAKFIAKNSRTIQLNSPFPLPKNQFVLGITREYVHLPILPERETCLAARVEGKSSRARCGILVHFTAPTIHPGFEGNITLEIINLGPVPFVLHADMPICQLIIEEVRGIPFLKPSQFQGQKAAPGVA